jgi:hypothetical protein
MARRLHGRVLLLLLVCVVVLALSHLLLLRASTAEARDAGVHDFGGVNYGAVSYCVDQLMQIRRQSKTQASKRCAVVGSSDILRFQHAGSDIDGHDLVFRINHAPTKGYESMVGNKTSYRLVNHVVLDRWMSGDSAEFSSDLCLSNTVDRACLYFDRRRKSLVHYLSIFQESPIVQPDRQFLGLSKVCRGIFMAAANDGKPMSLGMVGVLYALQHQECKLPVSIFGFYPFCCK